MGRASDGLGERIKRARLSAMLSQEALARKIAAIARTSVNKSLVSQWERGTIRNPQNANLLALADVTGFSATWLVTGKGPEREARDPVSATPPTVERARIDPDRLAVCIEVAMSAFASHQPAALGKAVALAYWTETRAGGEPDKDQITQTMALFLGTQGR